MIVQPDFLDHWKTQLLQELLGDPMAPIYVIRLWGHCQNRKTHRFPRVSPSLAKAICKAPQDAELFENSMIEAGFIEIEDGEIIAHDWDDANASLIANWENGKKGGRPRKKTQKKPMGLNGVNPSLTHQEPIREEKRRLEKIREEKNSTTAASADATDGEVWISAKKRTLKGKRLETFKLFWEAFDYRKDRANAIDAWLDIPSLTQGMVDDICRAAQIEAMERPHVLKVGKTPIYPQGWITKRRWEDEATPSHVNGSKSREDLFSSV